MMLNIKSLYVIFFIGFNLNAFSQDGFQLQNGKSDKIHFRLINNLIVIPVSVNGVSLFFLLDTGVSKPIIFNFFNLKEELSIHETELLLLQGLGDDKPIEALKSSNNTVIIGEAINLNQDLYAIIDASINFAPSLGIPIHGIIGYDVFKDFIVEINYSRNFVKLHNPLSYDSKLSQKWRTSNLTFYNKKPIVKASVTNGNQVVPVNLLIDTGGSDALWIFEDSSESLKIPRSAFDDFLGKGLSGNIYWKRSVFESFRLKDFQLNKFFYKQIGNKYNWVDRLIWTDRHWIEYVSNENLLTFVLKYKEELCGYFELIIHKDKAEIEIAYFGLLEEYFGKKLGGYFLSEALKRSFLLSNIRRVWCHTCSLDHKNALKNYLSRGMNIFKTEIFKQ